LKTSPDPGCVPYTFPSGSRAGAAVGPPQIPVHGKICYVLIVQFPFKAISSCAAPLQPCGAIGTAAMLYGVISKITPALKAPPADAVP
jgi:hypothetical protein